jgi:hypothetical protein
MKDILDRCQLAAAAAARDSENSVSSELQLSVSLLVSTVRNKLICDSVINANVS